MTDAPDRPAAPVAEPRRSRRAAISVVWLVPIAAIAIALAIAWQSYRDRGLLISVTFPDASGVTVGQTTLRFREVIVGVVEEVAFTADLSRVNVYIRVNKDIAPYLDADASFWIVQPEVTTRGVQGLETILSGTYVEGTWDNTPGATLTAFVGDERAPIIPPGVNGTAIVLRAKDSSRLGSGAPILFRGIEVGEVAAPQLSPDGTEVRVDAFVLSPYDRQLSTATRFWDASGVSAAIGPGGVNLRIGSLASIIEGGVNFDTLISGGQPIPQGYVYSIFDDEDDARASTYEIAEQRSVTLSALFPTAAPGLIPGAPVRYNGIRVGSVVNVTGFIRPDDPGGDVQLLTVLELQTARMGLDEAANDLDAIDFVDQLVRQGLRATLVSTSILGGELAVELVDNPEALTGEGLEIGVAANPLIPTLDVEIQGLTASAESVLARINDLPVEELLAAATDLLQNVNRIAADDATRAIPAEALALLSEGQGLVRDGRSIISSPQVAGVLADIEAVTGNLRAVSDDIAERQVATALADALTATTDAARNVAAGTADLGDLTASARTVLDGAAEIVDDEATRALPSLARDALAGARDLTTAPELATILSDTAAATADIRALIAPFDGTALAQTFNRTLAAIDVTTANVAAGTTDLDVLRTQIAGVLTAADTLLASADTQALPGAARGLLEDGRGLVNAPEVRAILADLATATADIEAITTELRERDATASLVAALDAAAAAARSVADGTANLPQLSASAERVLAQAETLSQRLNDLTAKANDLALDELVNATTDLARTADAFLSSDEADDVPVVLAQALEELRLTIETVRTGGTLDNLNATLRSTASAADGIRAAAGGLPDLVARLQELTTQAGGVLGTYGEDSRINTEFYAALRAVTRAAEDVSSLSRTIERNPNSLLLGR